MGIVSAQVMEKVGMNAGSLVKKFLGGLFVLIVLLVFIFMGIGAFSNAGTFGSVVNSCMVVGAAAAAQRSTDEKEEDDDDTEMGENGEEAGSSGVMDAIEEALQTIQAQE